MAEPQRKPKGRPRLHPDGLTSTVSIAMTRSDQQRLERIAQARGMTLSRLLRERLTASR